MKMKMKMNMKRNLKIYVCLKYTENIGVYCCRSFPHNSKSHPSPFSDLVSNNPKTTKMSHLTYKTFPEVNLDAVKFDGIRPGKNGMKFASLVGVDGRRLVIETPAMTIPWSTEIRKNEENGQCSSKIALSFQGMGDETGDGKVRRFFNFLNDVDQRVKDLALENRAELWQKNMDVSKIDAVFQNSVKPSTNDKYPPTFQGKIPLQEGKNPASDDVYEAMEMKIVVFRKDKTKVSPSELKGGCLASVIAEAAYVWCTPMMIGISWIVKCVLVEPKAKDDAFQFTDMDEFMDKTTPTNDDDDEEDEETKRANKRRKTETSNMENDDENCFSAMMDGESDGKEEEGAAGAEMKDLR